MRKALAVCTLLLLPAWLGAAPPRPAGAADRDAPSAALQQAQRELEIARLKYKLYERVDYPLRLRAMQDEIKLTEAFVESLRRRVAAYESFDNSPALLVTLENTRLDLLEAELRLKNLRLEHVLLQIHNRDERRLRQLEIERAQQRAADVR